MACRSCEERRKMLAEAKRKEGLRGVVKAIPAVGRHLIANPPKAAK